MGGLRRHTADLFRAPAHPRLLEGPGLSVERRGLRGGGAPPMDHREHRSRMVEDSGCGGGRRPEGGL